MIRPGQVQDLDRVIDVMWSVAAEGRWLGTEVPFDRLSRHQSMQQRLEGDHGTLFVAEGPDGQIVGYISVGMAPYGVADLAMALLSGWRGQGLGSALLQAGIDWAAAAGAHKMALEVWPDNTPAIALYRRAGFLIEGRKRRHYRRRNGELWDALLMGLALGGKVEPH